MADTMQAKRPLTDPQTGNPLPEREQPGFYPGFKTLSQQGYWDEATRKLVLERVTEEKPIRFFNPDEARTLTAVMNRILPQDDRMDGRKISMLPTLDDRLFTNRIEGYRYEDMPSDQEAYRLAARAFEQMAQELHGTTFAGLGTLQQEEMVKSLHDGEPLAAKEAWTGVNLTRFWALLVSDCVSAYYAHPWAWDEVGFGGPAYPRGYMRLEHGDREPWEVDERRYAWAAPDDTLSDRYEPVAKGHEQSHPGQGGTH